jgi:hypothetical protein
MQSKWPQCSEFSLHAPAKHGVVFTTGWSARIVLQVLALYEKLTSEGQSPMKKAITSGLGAGASQMLMFALYWVAFYCKQSGSSSTRQFSARSLLAHHGSNQLVMMTVASGKVLQRI